MTYLQLGQKFSSNNFFENIAASNYNFSEINPLGDIVTDGTNTGFQFDSFSISADARLMNVIGEGSKATVFTDWDNNVDTDSSENSGYVIGLKLAKGAWDINYVYAGLEESAGPDIFPDSDRFDGLSGINGHEIALNYKVQKNVILGPDYYNVDMQDINQDVLQLDLVFNF